jgi:outer membrane protein assembly factor BamB
MRGRLMAACAVLALLLSSGVVAVGTGRGAAVAQGGGRTAGVYGGSCDALGDVRYALRDLRAQGDSGVETSFTTLDVALAELTGRGGAVAVADGAGAVVTCGDIAGEGDDLFVALREQGDSGVGGIVWLHALGDRTQVSIFLGEGLSAAPGGGGDGPPEPPGGDDDGSAVVLPRGDAGRSGAMPGPGPAAAPTERWRFAAGAVVVRAPAVAGDTVYVATKNGGLFAVDAATGEERWGFDAGEEANVFAPAIAGGFVIVTIWGGDGPVLAAFDRDTGTEVWRRTLPGNPTEPVVADGVLYVAAGSSSDAPSALYALAPETGEEVWRREFPDVHSLGDAVAVADGLVFATAFAPDSADGAGLYAVDAATGQVRWTFTGSAEIVSEPVVGDGVVLVVDLPRVWALDAATGAERWQVQGTGSGGGAAVVGGVAYLRFEGEVRAVAAASGEERWSAAISGIAGAPAVAEGTVYLAAWQRADSRENDRFYALDAATGAEVWAVETELRLSGTQPLVLGGVLYADTARYLVALGS